MKTQLKELLTRFQSSGYVYKENGQNRTLHQKENSVTSSKVRSSRDLIAGTSRNIS